MPDEILYRDTASYRITLDRSGTGSIRVLKRINFQTFIRMLKDVCLESRKHHPGTVRITVYIPRSIHDHISGNVKELFDFCNQCTDLSVDVTFLE
ncbi:MAG TPA: hypothetical protein VGJ92_06270 [Methanocella sp.]|jgi:hypothetical protein